MGNPAFSIESTVSAPLEFASEGTETGSYSFGKGTSGLGLPPEVVTFRESAAGGGRVVSSRRAMRDATLVIRVHGTDRADVETKARALGAVLRTSSSPTLVARYAGGETWRLPFVRDDGGEDSYDSGGDRLLTWMISVRCPQPLWVREKPVELPKVAASGERHGLIPYLTVMPLTGSTATGAFTVENPGDEPVPIQWRLTGPAGIGSEVVVGGRGFSLATAVETDEVISIEYTAGRGWTVTDQDGENRYSILAGAPKFPLAPVGVTAGTAVLVDADSDTQLAGWFVPQRELIR